MPKRPQKKSNQPKQPEQPVPPEHPDARPEPGDIGLQAIAALDKHKKYVIIGTLVAGLAICFGLVARQVADQRRIAEAEAFSLAASERSIEKLDAVVDDYSGSTAAGNALLTKAEIQLSLDKPEDAKIALLTFIEDYKKHPRYVQGLFALGNLHHNTGDSAKAADLYNRALAAEPDSDIAPLIVIRQGDLSLEAADQFLKDGKPGEAAAKKDEARTFYEDSIRRVNFRANRFIPLAEEKISLLAIGDVPVVPAPPPPPPEPKKPEPVTPIPGAGPPLKPFVPGQKDPTKTGPGAAAENPAPKPETEKPKAPAPDAPKPGPGTEAPKKPDAPKAENPAAPKPAPAEKSEAASPAVPKPAAPTPAPKTEAPAPKVEGEKPAPPAPAPAPAPKPE